MDRQLAVICALAFVIHPIGTLLAQPLLVPAAMAIVLVARAM